MKKLITNVEFFRINYCNWKSYLGSKLSIVCEQNLLVKGDLFKPTEMLEMQTDQHECLYVIGQKNKTLQ